MFGPGKYNIIQTLRAESSIIVEQPQKFNKNDIRSFGKIGVQTKNR